MEANIDNKIFFFDTTLRDGQQTTGVDFSVEDKMKFSQALSELGVDYIEGGWPGSNPTDDAFFNQSHKLEKSKLVAFGMTRRPSTSVENDPGLNTLVNTKLNTICIVGKSSSYQVEKALEISLDDNLKMISDSIAYLVSKNVEALYDAEHFFDGYKLDPDYALKCLDVALKAGARWIVLCDTNGGTLPNEVYDIVKKVAEVIPSKNIGIHAHNDTENAVANSLAAVQAGARHVQGTINGLGERCGNANLVSVIPNILLKTNFESNIKEENLGLLKKTSILLNDILNRQPNQHQAYVGENAFAHKGGLHVSAINKDPKTYEHIEPEQVGNSRKILISELSGGSNLRAKLANRYSELEDNNAVKAILEEVQEKEHAGYSYENADGSFDLVVRRHIGKYKPVFDPAYYRIYSPSNEEHKDSDGLIEASVKLKVGTETMLCAAEGNGPVDALNKALQEALVGQFPVLSGLHLTDYSVRVINNTQETAAKVRVYLEHSFEGEIFGTIGVNVDIIKASWNALVEAYQYVLMQHVEFRDEIQVTESSLGKPPVEPPS